jgi:4-cresol dehydrogenase (hydroxylating) flavoprotein subunit
MAVAIVETPRRQAEARLELARQEWIDTLGADHVIDDPGTLRHAATATFATTQRVPLIIQPGTRDQVQACVRIANRHRIAIYPVSSGKNWGYGSKVPASHQNVVLDLSRMNQIVDFDEKLAYVTVEPGVSQQQLFDFLSARGAGLWMDATGSSPECSIIGNTMERGFGHTPYGDHFAHVCAMEVVLPTGECIETGFGRFGDASARPVYRWGVGPVLDGLFTQSNFGIVTRMTVWLMPAPEQFEAFFFRVDDEREIETMIEALRPLRLNGTLRSAVHIGNDYKVLNGIQQYPWAEMGGVTPITPERMRGFRKTLRIGAWNGSGALYGTKAQIAEARRILRERLKGKVAGLQFLNARKLALAARFAGVYRLLTGWDLTAALDLVKPVLGLMQGVPTWKPLASAYWRKRTPPPSTEAEMNPDRDGCGLLWCAPVAPLEGGHARKLAAISSETLLKHGFEPLLSMTLVTERALTCVIAINYDREVPGEDAKARACYHELLDVLRVNGYYSYRLGIQATGEMPQSDTYSAVLRAVKDAFDPNGILAPGRYGITPPLSSEAEERTAEGHVRHAQGAGFQRQ